MYNPSRIPYSPYYSGNIGLASNMEPAVNPVFGSGMSGGGPGIGSGGALAMHNLTARCLLMYQVLVVESIECVVLGQVDLLTRRIIITSWVRMRRRILCVAYEPKHKRK